MILKFYILLGPCKPILWNNNKKSKQGKAKKFWKILEYNRLESWYTIMINSEISSEICYLLFFQEKNDKCWNFFHY